MEPPLSPTKNLYISEIYARNCPLKNSTGYFSSLEKCCPLQRRTYRLLPVRINATLAAASNASLTAALADLQKRLSKPWEDPQPPHRETTRQRHDRPDCKEEVYRAANDCCELKNNAHLRHPGWRSRFFLWRGSNIIIDINKDKEKQTSFLNYFLNMVVDPPTSNIKQKEIKTRP